MFKEVNAKEYQGLLKKSEKMSDAKIKFYGIIERMAFERNLIFVREYHFNLYSDGTKIYPQYKDYRFDIAIPECMQSEIISSVAFEFEGAIWTNGGHVRGKQYTDNCTKYNIAQLMGWKVVRFTCDDFNSRRINQTKEIIERAFRYG